MLTAICIILAMMLTNPGVIRPDKLHHDFGSVDKVNTVLNCDFTLTNDTAQPVSIKDVVVGCHCTEVVWSTDAIAPGKASILHVTYNKEFYYDEFDKTITVHFNELSETVELRITGSFYDSPESLNSDFPVRMGVLGAQKPDTPTPLVPGQRYTGLVQLANCSNSSFSLSFEDLSPGLRLSAPDESLEPLSRTMVGYVIDSDKNTLGLQIFTAVPVVNGQRQQPLQFRVLCHEDFSSMSMELKDKGSLPKFPSSSCSFGSIEKGLEAEASIVVMNRGRSKLFFTSITAENPAVTAALPPEIIAGGAAVIKLKADTSKLDRGDCSITVYATTNSPNLPYISFVLTGTVN